MHVAQVRLVCGDLSKVLRNESAHDPVAWRRTHRQFNGSSVVSIAGSITISRSAAALSGRRQSWILILEAVDEAAPMNTLERSAPSFSLACWCTLRERPYIICQIKREEVHKTVSTGCTVIMMDVKSPVDTTRQWFHNCASNSAQRSIVIPDDLRRNVVVLPDKRPVTCTLANSIAGDMTTKTYGSFPG